MIITPSKISPNLVCNTTWSQLEFHSPSLHIVHTNKHTHTNTLYTQTHTHKCVYVLYNLKHKIILHINAAFVYRLLILTKIWMIEFIWMAGAYVCVRACTGGVHQWRIKKAPLLIITRNIKSTDFSNFSVQWYQKPSDKLNQSKWISLD